FLTPVARTATLTLFPSTPLSRAAIPSRLVEPAFTSTPFFLQRHGDPRDLHSFPTRRSSDLAFLLFLNPQCLASISRWITASSSWKRFCLFVCRALSSIMVICMLTAIRLLLTFVMSLYLLLRS